jgi:hypothetical protein
MNDTIKLHNEKASWGEIQTLSYDKEKETLTLTWHTGGQENAVCGITVKAPFVEEHVSNYKAPTGGNDSTNNQC